MRETTGARLPMIATATEATDDLPEPIVSDTRTLHKQLVLGRLLAEAWRAMLERDVRPAMRVEIWTSLES